MLSPLHSDSETLESQQESNPDHMDSTVRAWVCAGEGRGLRAEGPGLCSSGDPAMCSVTPCGTQDVEEESGGYVLKKAYFF